MKMHKNILTLFILFTMVVASEAQQVNTLYFLENVPVRHQYNPAIQPLSNFYLSLPIVGNFQFSAGNNSFTASSLNLSKNELFSSLKPITNLNVAADINLLGFGFRAHSSYFNFTVTSKSTLNIALPKDLFHLGMFGNVRTLNGEKQLENNSFDLSALSMRANSYMEAALGYSRILNEKWTAGLKLKYLHGLSNGAFGFDKFSYIAGIEKWQIAMDGTSNYAIPDFATFTPSMLLKPAGIGAAADLGVTFRPNENMVFGAAVTDLGMMRWTKSPVNYRTQVNFTIDKITGFTMDELVSGINSNTATTDLYKNLIDSVDITSTNVAYSNSLAPRINLSGEYGFLHNSVSIGLLSTTSVYKNYMLFALTPSLNIHPANWLNFALSYSLLNGRAANIGFGMGLRIGIFNTFITTDYIPTNYAPLNAPISLTPTSIPVVGGLNISRIPAKTDRLNVAIGFNIVFGNKQDTDHDGISNRRDKCPDTPQGVIVDRKGCPLDTDGDKVPDYYDKCPDTPKEAYSSIDADGCPLDTDGDGVFDYLDKCPDTPYQAYSTVDKNGCPKDTDKDSVPDYLDKCPSTPETERNRVDSVGCTIIVEQPALDSVVVDSVVVDSVAVDNIKMDNINMDAVNGNTNTPLTEVKPVVVDVDTDGDGIVDRLDRCPNLAGVASNDGCPEIKKEVRVIFQKALQGIQFESSKYTIKPLSYVILDHVARVLAENTNYLVEIQGHTDAVGNPDSNLVLSQNRADAVRNYLISKGVEANRLTAKGYGQMQPVAENSTIEGRAKNRRVAFIVSFE